MVGIELKSSAMTLFGAEAVEAVDRGAALGAVDPLARGAPLKQEPSGASVSAARALSRASTLTPLSAMRDKRACAVADRFAAVKSWRPRRRRERQLPGGQSESRDVSHGSEAALHFLRKQSLAAVVASGQTFIDQAAVWDPFRAKRTSAAATDESQVSAAADIRDPNINDRNQSEAVVQSDRLASRRNGGQAQLALDVQRQPLPASTIMLLATKRHALTKTVPWHPVSSRSGSRTCEATSSNCQDPRPHGR